MSNMVSKTDAERIVISAYLGESCKYCKKKFTTPEDLEDTVFAGCHENGRLAHKICWNKNNPSEIIVKEFKV